MSKIVPKPEQKIEKKEGKNKIKKRKRGKGSIKKGEKKYITPKGVVAKDLCEPHLFLTVDWRVVFIVFLFVVWACSFCRRGVCVCVDEFFFSWWCAR